MQYRVSGENIILEQNDFDLDQTLDCGQAFRWVKLSDSPVTYQGCCLNTPLTISQEGSRFTFYNTNEIDFLTVWRQYFDLDTDYGALKRRFCADITLKKACDFAPGIRLLRQDAWEALCSFIISQNNNIPRIKGIISRLCEHYGGFPDYKTLSGETAESLAFLRSGFRAKYLLDAASKLSSGEIDLEKVRQMPLEDARKTLTSIKGVGPKVCECALLYGLYKTEAFPVDVWIKRVLGVFYPNGLPDCIRGSEGIAQQYLFHYMRTHYQA